MGNQIVVVVKRAGKKLQAIRYRRPFAGMTVDEAVMRLDNTYAVYPKKEGLPRHMATMYPYFVNGEEVGEHSMRILQADDVLTCDDP